MRWRSLPIRLSLLFLFLSLVFSAALFPAKKKPPLKPVNLNTATSEELQQVPGIGPATAEKILQMRKSYGAFKSVGAFDLPATSKDAALIVTLPPGSYTAQISGVNNTTGLAIVEVYDLP